MRKIFLATSMICITMLMSCENSTKQAAETETGTEAVATGQSGVQDDLSQKNVVQVAIGSKDHSTLVTAIQAAELVDALSNAGPFTVFAPTNAAFDKLPAGTVDNLLKPESKDDLANILQYHVSLGVFKAESFTDGQIIGQVNGNDIKISISDGKVMINESAIIVASVPASNGIIHIIDGVLLPPAAN
ncbi:Uncaracterized surface protein containing fasciclin (FAS1) repeats [Daejeonella rubra]|uniref:Uncaracterized surface protein containing fasciclin (FAS1) repeats n=1 Tax=Daejeonella rubra TaxID=990371 RepID=A0A1G9LPT7_9SPHI|nr:fasciclin domain-containing protein [Daejeonella rubra]SDL64059.1 Uncaracterized surface protein containing fasciclin (FAS1) repeats [Daejeonella rubra]